MKTWFVTGTSRGFGRVWAEAALERGDRVAATARDPDDLGDLVERHGDRALPLALDVTDRAAAERAIAAAIDGFGQLDVVINNAGYGLFGMVEEVSEEQARAELETNFLGALWVTKAALPHLREQGSGHVIQVSSVGGVMAFPGLGLYHASKWALEGLTQALAAEVRDFGVKVTLVEPSGYTTDWAGSSAVTAERLPVYDGVRERIDRELAPARADSGDPLATGPVMLDLVDAEDPPLRILFGRSGHDMVREEYAARLAGWEAWSDLSLRAQGS